MVINPAAIRNLDTYGLAMENGKKKVTMSSNAKTPLNSFEGPVVSYGTVIEADGNDFERGFSLHKFNSEADEYPIVLCDVLFRGTNYSNGSNRGEEIELNKYKKTGNSFTKLYSEINTIYNDESFDMEVPNYTGSLIGEYHDPGGWVQNTEYYYAFNKYFTRVKRSYLSSKRTITYDLNGLNPVEQVVNYYYDNPNHLQLTRTETFDSNGNSKVEKKFYPDDLAGEPFMADLKTDNRIGETIMSESYDNGTKIFTKKASYIKNAASSNLLLVGNLYKAKFPNTLPSIANIGQLTQIGTFDKYDVNGNPLQFTLKDAVPVIFVWGYNKTMLIAKIENASYISLTSSQKVLIEDAESASDLDTNTSGESNLKSKLQLLRDGFPDSMVTTYTYDPLVGVTSITDPKASVTTFEYDAFGRLSVKKDTQGSILSQTKYHFKN